MEEQFSAKSRNKFYTEDVLIDSPNYKRKLPLNIVVISDFHYHKNVPPELHRLLLYKCRLLKPDFIAMPGDQVEDNYFLEDPKAKDYFESIIKELSEIAPLIMVPGNHDIAQCTKKEKIEAFLKRDMEPHHEAMKFFDLLNRINNVHFLNNRQVEIDGINFMGFSPRQTTYFYRNDKTTNQYFIDDYLNSGLKMKEDSFNILLTHSPIKMNQRMVVKSVEEFRKLSDLVITGHLHDGYMPKRLDKVFGNTNVGLFLLPIVSPIPGMTCRGVHEYGRGHLFISQGFRKWTLDNRLHNYLETINANDIERLIITNSEEAKIKRMKHI